MSPAIVASLGVFLVFATPFGIREAAAQCSTGCSSSSSCNGTGKAGCMAECNGNGECTCKDDQCGTQIAPPLGLHSGANEYAFVSGAVPDSDVFLHVDCRGNVLDVLLHTSKVDIPIPSMPTIVLRPPARDKPSYSSTDE